MRLNREQHSFTDKLAVFPNQAKRFALTKKEKTYVFLSNRGLSGEMEEEKDMIYFQSFYDAFHCSLHALVSIHTTTVTGTQRNCLNYTFDNY